MLNELVRAFAMLREPRVRSVLWLGIGLSLATLAALVLGVEALVSWASATGHAWLDRLFETLGVLGTLVVAWFLFPSFVVAISGVFLDRVVDATEDRYYPHLSPPRPVPLATSIVAALRLLATALVLNLLALPLYLVPLVNLPIWLALNGYLVAREYVELVALRRLQPLHVTALRRQHRLSFWATGLPIALLLAIPLLNLVAPIIGAAFLTQRVHRYGSNATHA
jgi:uncharacterized protein involved in cysteine biosynthesis